MRFHVVYEGWVGTVSKHKFAVVVEQAGLAEFCYGRCSLRRRVGWGVMRFHVVYEGWVGTKGIRGCCKRVGCRRLARVRNGPGRQTVVGWSVVGPRRLPIAGSVNLSFAT